MSWIVIVFDQQIIIWIKFFNSKKYFFDFDKISSFNCGSHVFFFKCSTFNYNNNSNNNSNNNNNNRSKKALKIKTRAKFDSEAFLLFKRLFSLLELYKKHSIFLSKALVFLFLFLRQKEGNM